MASFDAKRVTQLEWAGIGAGALAFIVSFFPWYTVSYEGGGFDRSESVSAWDWEFAFLGWLAMMLLLAAGVLVLLPHLGINKVPNLAIIWPALAGLSLLFIVLRWVTYDTASADFGLGGSFSAGAGFGLFVGLVLALASGVAGFLAFQQSRRTTAA
jgi:hypothetical protein